MFAYVSSFNAAMKHKGQEGRRGLLLSNLRQETGGFWSEKYLGMSTPAASQAWMTVKFLGTVRASPSTKTSTKSGLGGGGGEAVAGAAWGVDVAAVLIARPRLPVGSRGRSNLPSIV